MTNEEKEQVRKQALFLTNTAYLLADMANSCAIETESKLIKLGKCFQRDEKMRFKKAAKLANVDDACIDSDYLLEVIQLVINRTDETEESKTAMLEHIKKLPKIEHVEV